MNVLFHTTTAIGIAVLLTETSKDKSPMVLKRQFATAFFAFIFGVIAHGAIDYIPHCYPIHSKVDMILGLMMILSLTWLSRPAYRLIIFTAFIGSVFPDLVDLGPAMANDLLALNLPIWDKVFPWHWPKYSGSLYGQDCGVSNLNHFLVVFIVLMICWFRRKDLKNIFNFGG